MTKEYNIEDIIKANIMIRKEFSDKLREYDRKFDIKINEIKGYQAEVDSLKDQVRKLSDANRSLSLKVSLLEGNVSKPKKVEEGIRGIGEVDRILKHKNLTPWEVKFLNSIRGLNKLSDKQKEVFEKIVAK